jgi:hypothetical protein
MLDTIKVLVDVSPPHFHRQVWVNTAAREEWESKIDKLLNDAASVLIARLLLGITTIGILKSKPSRIFSTKQLCIKHGLEIKRIKNFELNGVLLPEVSCRFLSALDSEFYIVSKTKSDGDSFEQALESEDEKTLKSMLGIPPTAHSERKDGTFESLFSLFQSRIQTVKNAHFISLREEKESSLAKLLALNYFGFGFLNRCIGTNQDMLIIRSEHERILHFLENNFNDSYLILLQLLSWDIEISNYHGIVELKTPVLKFIRNSDVYLEKIVFRLHGKNDVIANGATGLRFPYRVRTQQSKL